MKPQRFLPPIASLLWFALAPALSAREPYEPSFAFSTPDGAILVETDGSVFLTPEHGAAAEVWSSAHIDQAVMAGRRLILTGEKELIVFEPGSWNPRHTPTEHSLVSLAGAPDSALAFDTAGGAWQLARDGSWTRYNTGLTDSIADVTHFRGTWVAVGSTPAVESDPETMDPDLRGAPWWIRDQLKPRIWWSADAKTWQAGVFPATPSSAKTGSTDDPEDDYDTADYGTFLAVAAGAGGWMAIGEGQRIATSIDGRSWAEGEWPEDVDTPSERSLTFAGGRFWLRGMDRNYDTVIVSSADGNAWRREPLRAGARCYAVFVRHGEAWFAGRRTASQPVSVAPAATFAEVFVPPPRIVTLDGATLPAGAALTPLQVVESDGDEPKALGLVTVRSDGGRLVAAGAFGSASGPSGQVLQVGAGSSGDRLLNAWERTGWTAQLAPKFLRTQRRADGYPQNINAKPGDEFLAGAASATQIAVVGKHGLAILWDESPTVTTRIWLYPDCGDMVSVATNGTRFVAVGSQLTNGAERVAGGVIEGTTVKYLSEVGVGFPGKLNAITYTGTEFVAVGATGVVLTSADGLTWTRWEIAGGPDLVRVGAAAGKTFACSADGTIYVRTGSEAWQPVARAPQTQWAGLFADAGGMTAYTADGTLLRLPADPVALPGTTQLAMIDVRQAELAREEAARLAAARQAAEAKARADRQAAEEKLHAVVDALVTFDGAALTTSSPEQLGSPAAALVKQLDTLVPGQLADAVFAAANHVLLHLGGARGYYGFMMGLPDGTRLQAATRQLQQVSKPQQELIRALSTQEVNRIFNRPIQPVDTRSWPPRVMPAREPMKSEDWDMATLRQLLATGTAGAAMDLQIAYTEGQSVPVDPLLAIFWSTVAEALIPDSQVQADEQAFRAAAAAGSAYARVWLAETLKKQDAIRHHDEILTLLTQARDGGYRPAARMLATAERAGRAKASVADWFKAATTANSLQAQAEIPGPELARLLLALQTFDDETYFGIESYVEWGTVLGELVTALDRGPDHVLADEVFKTAADFALSVGGAEGLARFYQRIPTARQSATLARVRADVGAFVEGRGPAPADWPAEERKARGAMLRDSIVDPATARRALVQGHHGAALDLGYGERLGDDTYPAAFWNAVGEALITGWDDEIDPLRLLMLEADAGSAMSQWHLAQARAEDVGPDAPEVLALLQRAAEGGSKEAAERLQKRTQVLASAAQNGTTFNARPREDARRPGIELLQLDGFRGDLQAVRRIDDAYYAVTDRGIVLRSTEAHSWKQIFTADNAAYEDITGGDGRLLLIPAELSRLTPGRFKHSWASMDAGQTWTRVPNDQKPSPHYALGKFWRYDAWSDNGRIVSGFASSTDLQTWERHRGIPADWLARAPTLRMDEFQLFNGRIYRHWRHSNGRKIESSTDFDNWQLELELPEGPVAGSRFPVQFEVVDHALVLGTMVALGSGPADYRILEPGQSWRTVDAGRTTLHSLLHADGWTLLHDNASMLGGLTQVTRDFVRFRTVASLNRHAPRGTYGPEGFVLVGDEGRVALLQPQPWWDLRPAGTVLAEAREAQRRGDYATMDRLIAEAREDEPQSEAAYVLEARAGFERNQAATVPSIVAAGLQHHPNSLELRGIRAFCRVSTADQPGAQADADAVLAEWPTQPEAALVRFMLTGGQAADALDAVLLTATDFAIGHTIRAMFRQMRGDHDGAMVDLRAAEKSRPEHADFLRSLAGVYQQLGALDDAQRCLLSAQRLSQPAPPPAP